MAIAMQPYTFLATVWLLMQSWVKLVNCKLYLPVDSAIRQLLLPQETFL